MFFSRANGPAVRCIHAKKRGMPLPSGLKISFCFHNNESKKGSVNHYLFSAQMYLCEPSQLGIFLDNPQMQSLISFPLRIRGMYFSIRVSRVLDCLASEK